MISDLGIKRFITIPTSSPVTCINKGSCCINKQRSAYLDESKKMQYSIVDSNFPYYSLLQRKNFELPMSTSWLHWNVLLSACIAAAFPSGEASRRPLLLCCWCIRKRGNGMKQSSLLERTEESKACVVLTSFSALFTLNGLHMVLRKVFAFMLFLSEGVNTGFKIWVGLDVGIFLCRNSFRSRGIIFFSRLSSYFLIPFCLLLRCSNAGCAVHWLENASCGLAQLLNVADSLLPLSS